MKTDMTPEADPEVKRALEQAASSLRESLGLDAIVILTCRHDSKSGLTHKVVEQQGNYFARFALVREKSLAFDADA